MIEIEYARQDDPQIRVLPDRLTVDAAGRARLRSYSNGRWPGVDGVGVFERQLRADELALLGKTLASEKVKAAGDPGQVPVGSLLRLLGVKDAAGTVTRAAAIGSEPPQLVPFFQQLDALMAELRGFPLRGAQLDWDLTKSAGSELYVKPG